MIKKKILIIEDDAEVIYAIKRVLEKEDYTVLVADNTEEGMYKVKKSKPDMIFLDINIPTIGGYELCRMIKDDNDNSQIPIIMISGKYIGINDKLMGFKLGANDYITKPFEMKELVARAKVWLDRAGSSESIKNVIKVFNITLNREGHTVTVSGKAVELRPKEYELLYTFMLKKNKVLNREYLVESVMGYESEGYDRTIDEHVKNLRKKLGKSSKYIKTIRNYGYKFSDSI